MGRIKVGLDGDLSVKQQLFAIKSPSQVLLWDTAASNKSKSWDLAYQKHLYRQYKDRANPTKAAYSNGWRCVSVAIIEIGA